MDQDVSAEFVKRFGSKGYMLALRSPGRVNLIGEHTDYNDGFVFPTAINLEIKGIAAPRKDTRINVYSMDYGEQKEFDLQNIKRGDSSWINYIKGVALELRDIGSLNSGADILFKSNLPLDSGLSSSAAFEVINALLLTQINDIKLNKKEIALLCQRAENNFVGVNCGIMDQFAVALAKKDSALFIDTRNLEFKSVPLNLGEYRILITNTNKPRILAESAYNQRRAECEQAVSILGQQYPEIHSLRDISMPMLQECKQLIDPLVFNRSRHVIEENGRVKASIEALKKNNLSKFGEYMNDSHDSLKELYQVSCNELDILVAEARKIRGVVGSRMTGAGFGGCTLTIIHQHHTQEFIRQVGAAYTKQTGLSADFYLTQAVDGAEILGSPEH